MINRIRSDHIARRLDANKRSESQFLWHFLDELFSSAASIMSVMMSVWLR